MKNKSYLDSKWDNDDMPRAFDNYFRQYIGYKKDGKLIVAVKIDIHFISADDAFSVMWLKNSIFCASGGGSSLLHVTIDLNEGRVISFESNGSCF